MKSNTFTLHPSSAKYRNHSQIQFLDQISGINQNYQNENIKKKMGKSYRTFSRLSQYMKDTPVVSTLTSKVKYVNTIQNANKIYEIPKPVTKLNENQQHRYQQFLQKNDNKIYKPKDQFCQYSQLLSRNSSLIRKEQQRNPLLKTKQKSINEQNNQTMSMIHSRYYKKLKATKYSNFTVSNSIWQSYQFSINQKKQLKKQKDNFFNQRKKTIKPFNKTFMGNVSQYNTLLNKVRQDKDKVPLANSMNRVLQMQIMGKKIGNLTQTFT